MFTELFGEVPTLASDLGAPQTSAAAPACLFPIDARLGVDGIPQSGTGQASILTGLNGPELFGRHFGPWIPTGLRDRVEHESFLRSAVDSGRSAAFLNAYPPGWPGPRGGRRIAGPPLAAKGAGLLVRTADDLRDGRAVASEITNGGWKRHFDRSDLPEPTPREAGEIAARLAADVDLSLFAHWATDAAGHRGGMDGAVAALEKVDAFLGGLVDARPADLDVLVCSDHGNIEDVTAEHTLNPALGAWIGPVVRRPEGPPLPDRLPALQGVVLDHLGVTSG